MSSPYDSIYVPTVEDVFRKFCKPHVVSIEKDHIILGDISCFDADGEVFEHYDRLRVDRDIVRNADGSQVNHTPYEWVSFFEKVLKKKKFLPCVALSCGILDCFWDNKNDKEIKKTLRQYKDKGDGCGWHAQNTLVHPGNGRIIHYPLDKDFLVYGGNNNINQSSRIRTERSFNPKKFKDMLLEDALQMPEFSNFIKNFTGLKQPETLIEIGNYFKKPAKIWVANDSEVCAAWLGCNNDDLDVGTDNDLNDSNAARGVSCEPAYAGKAKRKKIFHRKQR